MGKRIASALICVCLALSLLPANALAAPASCNISSGPLTINAANKDSYENAVVSGSVTASQEYLIIDGASVDLTIKDLSIVMTGDGLWSAMELKNGAVVNLTLEGTNTLTGTYGGAGIAVPGGCSLTITAASTGSLTATGGDNYGSGAGIGMVGNHYSVNSAPHTEQTLGSITIAGGTIVAQGGRNTYNNSRYLGSAGIGGASCGSMTASASAGSISITGGSVTAAGGENAAGIGGGSEGYAGSVSISGGSVTAVGGEGGAGIGGGRNGSTAGSGFGTPCGNITISGGSVHAVAGSGANAVGYGEYVAESNKLTSDSSVGISAETALQTEGAISPAAAVTGNTLPFSFTLEDGRVQKLADTAYTLTVTDSAGKSVSFKDIRPEQDTPAKAHFFTTLYTSLADIASASLAAGGNTWTGTLNGAQASFGTPLCKATLLFKSSAITADVPVSAISISQNGTALDTAKGEFYAPSVITKKSDGYGTMEIYLPAGTANTDISVTAAGLNSGSAMSVTGQTISDQGTSSILVLKNGGSAAEPFTGTLDISKGDISFSDASGDLQIAYTDADGNAQTATTLYEESYTITGSSAGNDAHQITVGNTNGQQVKIKLSGVTINNNYQAKSPVDLAVGASVLLESVGDSNTLSHGRQLNNQSYEDAYSDYPTVHVPNGATLALSGTGSLNIASFAFSYGASIGGKGSAYGTAAENGGSVIVNSGTVSISNSLGTNVGIGGGKAVKAGSTGGSCGNVTVNGGVLSIGSNAVCIGGGDGGATGGSGGAVVINGGTVLLSSGSGCSGIGAGNGSSASGSVTITGGSVSAAMAAETTNGNAAVYKTAVDLSAQYGSSAAVPASDISGLSGYGINDLRTNGSGKLYFYLPVGEKTILFNGTAYAGTAAASNDNVLAPVHTLTAAIGTVTSSSAALNVTGENGGTVYCALSSTALTNGPAVVSASRANQTLSGTAGDLSLTSLASGTAYTCYLVEKIGEEYSPVVSVSFTTSFADAEAETYTAIDFAGETLRAKADLSYTVQYSTDNTNWSELTSSGGVSLTSLLDGSGGTVYVRKNNSGTFSTPATVTVPARAEYSGAAPVIDYADETVSFAAGTEYKININGSGDWTAAPAAAVSLDGHISNAQSQADWQTIFCRTKATDSSFASKTASSKTLGRPDVDKPKTSRITDTAITLVASSGAQYSIDGTTWQDSPAFSGLTPETAYTFYQRIKPTASSFASVTSSASFSTMKYDLSSATVTLSGGNSFVYNGDPQTPGVTVTLGGKTLTENTDYTFIYQKADFSYFYNPMNAGTYHVAVTGKGEYGGTVSTTFTITKKPLTVTAADQTIPYGGSIDTALKQVSADGLISGHNLRTVTLTADGAKIVPSDAAVAENGTDRTGNYSITYVPGVLTILKLTPTIAFSNYSADKTYDGTALANPASAQLTLTGAQYADVVFTWYKNSVSEGNKLSAAPTDAGTYVVTASIPETAGTNAAGPVSSDPVTISVKTVAPVIELPSGTLIYDGKAKTPAVTVKDGAAVIPTDEYTVSYSDNTNAGSAAVTVTDGAGGNYAFAAKSVSFAIAPVSATARPGDVTVTAGDAAPTLALTYGGLLAGETITPSETPVFKLTKSDKTEIALADAVKTAGSYTITWSNMDASNFSAAANYSVVKTAAGTLTVKQTAAAPSAGGGGGGDSSAQKVAVPVSSGEGSVKVEATLRDKTATVTITDQQLAEIASSKTETGTVKLDVSGLKVDAATIPAKIVAAAEKASGSTGLEVALPTGTVTLDKTALAAVSAAGTDVTVSVDKVDNSKLTAFQRIILGRQASTAVVVDVNVTANGAKVSTFDGGSVRITVPYTPKANENPRRLVVWYIADNGRIERMTGGYDAASGTFSFTTGHLSQYALVSFPFTDVPEDSWYYGSAAYAYMNGLFSGTSETAFSPEKTMTRGMLVTVLYRMAGSPAAVGTAAFSDVAANAYCAQAVSWASASGLVTGFGDGSFAPDRPVTREQLTAILYRYARYKSLSVSASAALTGFTDAADVSEYAVPAMQWAVGMKLLQGAGGALSPQAGAPRAQVAAILQRFEQQFVK